MKCEICNRGPEDGESLFRVNEYGVKGVWRCHKDLTAEQRANLDPETVKIVDIINPPKPE